MTRETLLAAVKAEPYTTPLGGEIEHQMSIEDREYAYDEVSALFDAYRYAEQETKDRRVIERCRDLLVEHGFYRVMPQEERDNTFTSSGRAPYDFKRKGVMFTTDFTIDNWQWPDVGSAEG